MARYTVLERTFINGSIANPGEVVEYDGQPGSSLQPMDTRPSVDIPDNWRDKNGLERIALARSLGAPKARLSAAEADVWINNEIANREAKSSDKAKPSFTDRLMQPSEEEKAAKAKREADEAAAKKAADEAAAKAKADADKSTT